MPGMRRNMLAIVVGRDESFEASSVAILGGAIGNKDGAFSSCTISQSSSTNTNDPQQKDRYNTKI